MNTAAAQWSENTALQDSKKVYAGQQNRVEDSRKDREQEDGNLGKVSGRAYDEFIRADERNAGGVAGIYSLTRDDDGSPKIVFEDPGGQSAGEAKEAMNKADEIAEDETPGDGKQGETVTVSTDRVDAEIRELKADYQRLKEQLTRAASDDPEKKAELERRLAEIEMALNEKDNDTYRKQHAVNTYGGGTKA